LNGITYGLLLFMLASGLTLIFSMMGVLNFRARQLLHAGRLLRLTRSALGGFLAGAGGGAAAGRRVSAR
jgi:branched-chain amino acid transport system permease protein